MSDQFDPTVVKKNRIKLAIMIIVPMAIILSAQLFWWLHQQGKINIVEMLGTKNKGELLMPALNIDNTIWLAGNQPMQWQQGQWYLLLRKDKNCGVTCEELDELSANIHLALGKRNEKATRIVLEESTNSDVNKTKNIAGSNTQQAFYTPQAWNALIESHPMRDEIVSARLMLVDGRGYIALLYPDADKEAFDGKDILYDMKFLIKTSQESQS